MSKLYRFLFLAMILIIGSIAVKWYFASEEQPNVARWQHDNIPDQFTPLSKNLESDPAEAKKSAQTNTKTQTSSSIDNGSGFVHPSFGQLQIDTSQFVVADNQLNRQNYPHGRAEYGLWVVALLPGMARPLGSQFLIKTDHGHKVASGLMSVKLRDFQRDYQENLFDGASIHKLIPHLGVVIYRFENFDQMMKAQNKAQNTTKVLYSEVEIIDRPRKAQ